MAGHFRFRTSGFGLMMSGCPVVCNWILLEEPLTFDLDVCVLVSALADSLKSFAHSACFISSEH